MTPLSGFYKTGKQAVPIALEAASEQDFEFSFFIVLTGIVSIAKTEELPL